MCSRTRARATATEQAMVKNRCQSDGDEATDGMGRNRCRHSGNDAVDDLT